MDGDEEVVEAAAAKKAAEAAASLNLAEDAAEDGAPDGEAVVNGEIVRPEGKAKKGEEEGENYELDRPAQENGL